MNNPVDPSFTREIERLRARGYKVVDSAELIKTGATFCLLRWTEVEGSNKMRAILYTVIVNGVERGYNINNVRYELYVEGYSAPFLKKDTFNDFLKTPASVLFEPPNEKFLESQSVLEKRYFGVVEDRWKNPQNGKIALFYIDDRGEQRYQLFDGDLNVRVGEEIVVSYWRINNRHSVQVNRSQGDRMLGEIVKTQQIKSKT